MCLLRQFGERAMSLLLQEIEKQPTLYPLCSKPYRDSVAWGKVLEKVKARYPGVSDRVAWRSWYCFRYNYQRNSCSQKWKDRMAFVNPSMTAEELNAKPTGGGEKKRGRPRKSENKEEEADEDVEPRSKVRKEDDDDDYDIEEDEEEEEDFDESSDGQDTTVKQMYPRDEDCFDASYKKRPDVIKRNPHAITSNCLLRKYGDEAMEVLIDEIKKYPSLYPLTSKPYRDTIAWGKVLEAVQAQFPVTDKEAWRSWYCFRYNYYRHSCSQKWKERMSYVDSAPARHVAVRPTRAPAGPKVHKFSGGNPLAQLQQCRRVEKPLKIKYEDEYGNLHDSALEPYDSGYDRSYGSFADGRPTQMQIKSEPAEPEPDEEFPPFADEDFSDFTDQDYHHSTGPTTSEIAAVTEISHIIGAPAPKTTPRPAPPPPKPAPKIMRLYTRPPNQTQTQSPVMVRRIPAGAAHPGTSMTLADVLKSHSAQAGPGVRTIRLVRGNTTRVLTTARPQAKPVTNGTATLTIDQEDRKPVIVAKSEPAAVTTPRRLPPAAPAPQTEAKRKINTFFQDNLKKMWIDLETMEDGNAHISILKKKIMSVLNNAFAEV